MFCKAYNIADVIKSSISVAVLHRNQVSRVFNGSFRKQASNFIQDILPMVGNKFTISHWVAPLPTFVRGPLGTLTIASCCWTPESPNHHFSYQLFLDSVFYKSPVSLKTVHGSLYWTPRSAGTNRLLLSSRIHFVINQKVHWRWRPTSHWLLQAARIWWRKDLQS